MFRNILIPTDGSALAMKGARAGIKLAQGLGAKVTAVYIDVPYIPAVAIDAAIYAPLHDPKRTRVRAARALGPIERAARAGRVRCKTLFLTDLQPWRGILRAARRGKCDAIVMASHGRGGLRGVLLGSETTRVLANSKLPVVVIR